MSSRTTTDKREQARAAARQAEMTRARRARLAVVGTLAVVGLAVVGLVVAQQDGGADVGTSPSASGGLLTGPPPWPAQKAGLNERVAGLGFPPVGDESYHAHALLSVYRNGQQVPVPADLGYDQSGRHSSLHTHTLDGVIHMEADDPYPYTLAHVMTTWGVAFDAGTLGGDRAAGADKVHIFLNGQPATPDVELKDGDNVVVAYGREGSFPVQPDDSALDSA